MSKTTQEKTRVYALAKELKVENKQVLELCQELGFSSITNQLHGLDSSQVDAVKKRLKEGSKTAAPGPAMPKPAPAVIPPPLSATSKVRTLPPPKPRPAPAKASDSAVVEARPENENAPVVDAIPDSAPMPPPVVEAAVEMPEPVVEVVSPTPPAPAPLPPSSAPGRNLPNLNANRPPSLRGAIGGRPSEIQAPPPRRSTSPAPAAPAQPQQQAPFAPSASTPAPAATTPPAPVAPTTPVQAAPTAAVQPPAPAPTPAAPSAPTHSATTPPRPAPMPPRPLPPAQSGGGGNRPPNLGGNSGGSSRPPQPAPPNPQGRPGFPPPRVGPPGIQRSGPMGHGTGHGHSQPQQTGHGQNQGQGGQGQGGPNRPPIGPRPPAPSAGPKGQVRLTPEQIAKLREAEKKKGGKVELRDVHKVVAPTNDKPAGPAGPGDDRAAKPGAGTGGPARPARGGPMVPATEDDEKPKRGPGEVAGRDSRTKHRIRDKGGKGPTDKGAVIIGTDGQVDVLEEQHGSRKGQRAALLAKLKRQKQQQTVKKEGPVEIPLPITVRSLSEAIGMKVGELSKQLLKETQQLYGANSPVAFDVAELIAIGKGITLVAKKVQTREDILLQSFKEQAELVEADKLRPRPPIVTIMGHVDHGKTSLLDRIREEYGLTSDVVSTEAGGITQVIRAWRVEKDGKPTTFLDTPGHEAFTKMRARGAKVTDIAVIVVAATDGVMPQTEEAISHAKAADVDIIVAINKVDMPNANVDKTRRQLYSLGLLPDNMGGEVPFVETSAITGQGIGELLDSISIVAELADLKADPEHKPSGTCLEAYMEGERGVMATLLVQQGTLRKGDVILCGSTFGRVRAMYDDMGKSIDEAGPSTPVKVIGLDDVPDADDPFYYVNDVSQAREIGELRKQRQIEAGRTSMAPKSLDALKEATARAKISELKVVLKAEVRGSVEAIRKELEKLVHEEVRCRVLHSGIGAITEADVTLALTSPADTLVIGFNVTADDTALRIADERGISIREYNIIYKLTDDVKAALEGRLKPVEEVVHLGRAVIREAFKISKVGTIAGCYVTSGVIERSARVRVIREGTVIYPPAEKTLGLDSLKRFKDDVKEVREGFECGLKITGFDDVKVGDVIEAFRIEIRHRTL